MPRKPPIVATDGSAGNNAPRRAPLAQNGVFRKEGEHWMVGLGAKTIALRNSKGLSYLAYLLRHPAAEFHVLDLVGGMVWRGGDARTEELMRGLPRTDQDLEKESIHLSTLGDAGELLDDQAKAAYRSRLSELREELEQAETLAHVEHAEQAEMEIEELTRELSRAVGLGGRSRRASSASERARQTVKKTINAAVERISQDEAELAAHLKRCIKTGYFCSYRPERDLPIAWRFGETSADTEVRSSAGAQALLPTTSRSHPTTQDASGASPFLEAERTIFVGRETERATIGAALDRAMNGWGSVIVLAGGPGVGKTRLAIEMAEYAGRLGFGSLVGHCYESKDPVPHLPFVEIIEGALAGAASLEQFRELIADDAPELAQLAPSLRRIYPDIPQALELPPAHRRRQLFQSFAEFLARTAQRRGQLYILEDLHWADESTLALLIHLANRVTRLPLVIIGTYRDGFSDTNAALLSTLEQLIRLAIRPLKLGGLSKNDVARMLQALGRHEAPETVATLIFEESQGNPFFVEEVYRHLLEEGKLFDAAGEFRIDIKIDEIDVPDNVRLVIGRRLERLAENEKRVLAAAAIIGRSFSFQLLTEICQVDVDDLFTVVEKAQQMGIVVASSEGPERPFTFGHELVRQTLLGGISVPRQQRLHAGVADAIERLHREALNERAGDIAGHLLKAGPFADERKLIHWLTLAGNGALEAAAFEEARRSFRSALSHRDAIDPEKTADLLISLAMAESGLERYEMTLVNLREALEVSLKIEDAEKIGKSFTELTAALLWTGRLQEAVEVADRGLSWSQTVISADRVRLLTTLAPGIALSEGYRPAEKLLQQALDLASQVGDPKLVGVVLGSRSAINYFFFRLRETVSDGLQSKQLCGPETSLWLRSGWLIVLHQALFHLGRSEDARKIADELKAVAKRIVLPLPIELCLWTDVWEEFARAHDLVKLEADLRKLFESDQRERLPMRDVHFETQLSLVNLLRGDWATAQLHAEASCRVEEESYQPGRGTGPLFLDLAYAGDRVGAMALLNDKRLWLPRIGQANTSSSWFMLTHVIEGLVMLGEYSQAGDLYQLISDLINTGTILLWPTFRFVQTIAGIAAGAARRWETAENHFQIALQQAKAYPNFLEQAEIRRFTAVMLLDRAAPGDIENARQLLIAALEIYTLIGMPRHMELTQALMQRAAA